MNININLNININYPTEKDAIQSSSATSTTNQLNPETTDMSKDIEAVQNLFGRSKTLKSSQNKTTNTE